MNGFRLPNLAILGKKILNSYEKTRSEKRRNL